MNTEDFFSLEDLKPASIEKPAEAIENKELAKENEKTEADIAKEAAKAPELEKKVETPEVKTEKKEDKSPEEKGDLLIVNSEKKTGDAPLPEKQDESSFSVFAKYLKEEGVLSESIELEKIEGIKSVEDLKEIIKIQIEKARYSDLTESQRRYLDSVESGIPLNEIQEIEQNITSIKSIDKEVLENDVQLRFDLIVTDFIESGINEERAITMAQRIVDANEDLKEAETAKANMLKRREDDYKNILKEGKEKKISTLKEVEDYVSSRKEKVLDSIELDDSQRKKVYELMVNQVDTTETGAPVNAFGKWRKEKGLEAEFILNALYLHTNGFKNLGSIENQIASSSAKKLEELLKSSEEKEIADSLSSGLAKGTLTLL